MTAANTFDTATPYIASFALIRKDGLLAFVLRKNTKWMNGYYGLPSGKTEKDESFSAGAMREVLEEVGITVKPKDLTFAHIMHRSEDGDWVDVFFEVTDYEGEVYNAEPHMHEEVAWLDPNNLPDTVIPSLKYALEQIAAGKMYSEYGWTS